MARTTPILKEEQWNKLEPLLPKTAPGKKGGRPWKDNRRVLEGILWVLKTGARWRDLPDQYPSPSTCWRRLKLWEELDIWLDVWRALLAELDERQYLDWKETFADGSFAPAKKGGPVSGKPSAARVRSGWWWLTAKVFLFGSTLASASPAEVKLIEETLEQVKVPRRSRGRPRKRMRRLIADKAYDSDPLRRRLKTRKIELICPHRRNRKKPKLQDGRKLRRYRRRWKVERTFAWLGNFRRLVVRWDRLITIYRAFFHLACLIITLRQL